tara:strand:+ start:56 stop:304 length:249 start_codon:yes stop_codon:yes gene_type:complete
MEKIELDDFLTDGILKEKEFRTKIKEINWGIYKQKKVLIKGCTTVPVPTWSYLIITAKLTHIAKSIYFGEPCSAVEIYKNEN